MAPSAQPDRYEPLPPLLEIPGHLVRKMSPRARRIAIALLLAFAVALAVGIPLLIAAKQRDNAAADRAAARAKAARIAALQAEVRLIDGSGTAARGLTGAKALTARHALVQDLAGAVSTDAARRAASGEFAHAATRVECSRFPPGARGEDPAADLGARRGRYACLAITAEFPHSSATTGGALGYPYRAMLDFRSGHFTFCKISGRPGEMLINRSIHVAVPPACGGTR
jgi:hypothetical protein